MKRRLIGTALLLALATTWSLAANRAGDEKQLIQMTHDLYTAMRVNDNAALKQIWAEDFMDVNSYGEVETRAHRLQDDVSGATHFERLDASDFHVRFYGATGIVIGVVSIKATIHGHPTEGKRRVTLVYVKRKGRWECVSSQYTPLVPRPAPK